MVVGGSYIWDKVTAVVIREDFQKNSKFKYNKLGVTPPRVIATKKQELLCSNEWMNQLIN